MRLVLASARRSPTLATAIVVAVVVVVALVHVWVRLQVIQSGYDLSRENRARHELGEQNQKLRLELDVRKSPKSIDERARRELHMAPPDPSMIRVLTVPAASPAATAKVRS